MKFIAGEDIEPGEMIYINASDGKVYPARFYTIKHGKIGERPIAVAAEHISKDSVGLVYASGQFRMSFSRRAGFAYSLKRFYYRLRGKYLPPSPDN